jgi:hypothetical protein
MKNPDTLTGAGERNSRQTSDTQFRPKLQPEAREAARFLVREHVYESAEQARLYLDCLLTAVAADDVPGLRYACKKIAAYGRVIALGCKELTRTPGVRLLCNFVPPPRQTPRRTVGIPASSRGETFVRSWGFRLQFHDLDKLIALALRLEARA